MFNIALIIAMLLVSNVVEAKKSKIAEDITGSNQNSESKTIPECIEYQESLIGMTCKKYSNTQEDEGGLASFSPKKNMDNQSTEQEKIPKNSVPNNMTPTDQNNHDCVKDDRSMTGYICKGAAKPIMKGESGCYDTSDQLKK